jgi:hypothetical protein
MALSETNKIDTVGTSGSSRDVILTLIDEQDWENEHDHLMLLQDKINAYVRFVESGELLQEYPSAEKRNVVIEIVAKHPPSTAAEHFFNQAKTILEDVKIVLRFRVFA